MKSHFWFFAVAGVCFLTGCVAPVQTVNLADHARTVSISRARIVSGKPINVAVAADDAAIYTLDSSSGKGAYRFVPRDGTPLGKQVARVQHEHGVQMIFVFENYGQSIGSIVEKNMSSRFSHATVTVAPTVAKADCVIQPETTFEGLFGAKRATVTLIANTGGKSLKTEATTTERVPPMTLFWELPIAVGTLPFGTVAVAEYNMHLHRRISGKAVTEACSQASGKLADELASRSGAGN